MGIGKPSLDNKIVPEEIFSDYGMCHWLGILLAPPNFIKLPNFTYVAQPIYLIHAFNMCIKLFTTKQLDREKWVWHMCFQMFKRAIKSIILYSRKA